MGERTKFATKLGVIATTVGSAVGLGNIWRFPYEAGMNGGGAFLMIYILCVLILGVPVMCAEFIIGRKSKSDTVDAFKKLIPGSRWYYIGYIGILASILILGYYMVISGWTLEYLFQAACNNLTGKTAAEFKAEQNAFIQNDFRPLLWIYIFLFINYIIISKGVQKGIEKMSNILMPILFIILIVFCIRSLTLPEANEGLKFFLHPDFSKITPQVIVRAMGQAFFSLSLGMGILITYSSYFNNKTHLIKTASTVAILDTTVAILAGVIIFPAVFSYGVDPAAVRDKDQHESREQISRSELQIGQRRKRRRICRCLSNGTRQLRRFGLLRTPCRRRQLGDIGSKTLESHDEKAGNYRIGGQCLWYSTEQRVIEPILKTKA